MEKQRDLINQQIIREKKTVHKEPYLELLDISRPSGLIQWTSGSGSPFALHFRLAGWPSIATVCGDLRVRTGGSQINSYRATKTKVILQSYFFQI